MNANRRLGCVALFSLIPLLAGEGAEPDRSTPPKVEQARRFTPPALFEDRLPNGIRVLLVERHKIPVAHVIWGIRTGTAVDPPGLSGASAMLAEMLVRAAESGGDTLEQRLRARGVLLDVNVNRDRTWYSMQVPREQFKWSLQMLQRSLLDPKLSDARWRQVRQRMINELAQEQGNPERIRDLAVWLAAYGEDHPYNRPIRGNRASLGEIELQHLRTLHRDHYRPGNTFLVVSGDVRARDLKSALGDSLGRWKTAAPDPEAASPAARSATPKQGVVLVDLPGSSQAQISVVSPLHGKVSPLDPGASVMNTLLGGSAGSRLNRSLRGQYAYAYGASSRLEFRQEGGHLSAGTTVSVADAPDAVRQLVLEVERMRQEPETNETDRARRYLENNLLALFETNRSIARLRARIESMNIDQDALQTFLSAIPEVEPQQVVLSARRCVSTKQLSVVVVGDRQALEEPLGELGMGPVRVWSIERLWGADRSEPSAD